MSSSLRPKRSDTPIDAAATPPAQTRSAAKSCLNSVRDASLYDRARRGTMDCPTAFIHMLPTTMKYDKAAKIPSACFPQWRSTKYLGMAVLREINIAATPRGRTTRIIDPTLAAVVVLKLRKVASPLGATALD